MSSKVLWFYFCDKRGWAPLDEVTTTSVEAHHRLLQPVEVHNRSKRLGPLTLTHEAHSYIFDTVAMMQKNVGTGKVRALRRETFEGQDVEWQVCNSADPCEWTSIGPFQTAMLEYVFRCNNASPTFDPRMRLTTRDQTYELDIERCSRQNLASGEVQCIRRLIHTGPHKREADDCDRDKRSTTAALPSIKRLLFPSISTNVFCFDLDKAAEVAIACIVRFLHRYPRTTFPHLRLTLVDAPKGADTDTIRTFKNRWHAAAIRDDRLEFVTCDITKDNERPAAYCIANAANATFAGGPRTSGFNRALHIAANSKELEADTREKYPKGGSCGPAYDVALRPTSPLYAKGVRHIIHVVGPNMNPARPNCLHGDYVTGSALLRQVYDNMFETFVSLTK